MESPGDGADPVCRCGHKRSDHNFLRTSRCREANCTCRQFASPPKGRKRTRHERELRLLLAETYTSKGIDIWLAHADNQGWSHKEKVNRARRMADGNFS